MATLNITGSTWSYLPTYEFPGSGIVISGSKSGQILSSITLRCSKFTNYGYGFQYSSSSYVPAGVTTSLNDVSLRVRVNGVYAKESYTFTRSYPMTGNHTRFGSYVTIPQEGNEYTFTWDDIPIGNNQVIYCDVTGVSSYATGIAMRIGSGTCGTAEVFDEPQGPTSISVSPVSGEDGWITDLSGAAENTSQGVLKDYVCQYTLTPNPSNAQISLVNFSSSNSLVSCSYNYSTKIITVTATRNNIDYPSTDTVTVSVNGGASTTFTVHFYEKPKANLSGNNSIELNIRTANGKGFGLSGYNVSTINTASDRALFFDGNYQSSFAPQNSNTLLNVGQYLSLASNNSNLFKISGEGSRHTLLWRFFNHYVQTNTSNVGTYKRDLTTYVTWYITPDQISQFSFDWLDINNVITEIPNIILPDFDSPIIGNLRYSNASVSGGYCRGFRVEYINEANSVVRTDYLNATIDSNGVASTSGRLLSNNLNNIPYNQLITIRITMYFYYNDSTTTRYYGASYTLQQKLLRINEEELYPTLVFPTVSATTPYTPMMLTEVERFGYEISDLLINNQNLFNAQFGLLIGGKELSFTTAPEYISSQKLTKHIVYNVGKFVEDNNLYNATLTVLPYIDIFYGGTTYSKRISASGNTTLPNVIINTLESTMWNRPIAEQGEYVTYYDYNRFMQFINKYKVLNNNILFNVPTNLTGEIINTDFWVDKANKLDIYAENMQDWATDVTNFVILWALPEFKHQKGEIINNNNLYQNYYDLLVQHSGYESFASHNYLHDSNYTHNALGNYTHNQITNKEGI